MIDPLHKSKKCFCYGYPYITKDCYVPPLNYNIEFNLPLGKPKSYIPAEK